MESALGFNRGCHVVEVVGRLDYSVDLPLVVSCVVAWPQCHSLPVGSAHAALMQVVGRNGETLGRQRPA